ncbi:hypothetical protein BN2475_190141 [Paraburkholderia ribeironis]|uniref:Uncharacterized protein n=1 Tax=Paraburkholderia ribeironis TaxID=1247936 RepID=A0A1N7RVY9_9BURK|nr:hypothetical protein BN2475_190141 [Paraburkholderia ribeironis]
MPPSIERIAERTPITLIVWLLNPAPPKSITMSAGPPDSSLLVTANQYRKILARNGIRLNVWESDGSVQNLQRLLDPKQHVDIALVQGGVATGHDTSSLMSRSAACSMCQWWSSIAAPASRKFHNWKASASRSAAKAAAPV